MQRDMNIPGPFTFYSGLSAKEQDSNTEEMHHLPTAHNTMELAANRHHQTKDKIYIKY